MNDILGNFPKSEILYLNLGKEEQIDYINLGKNFEFSSVLTWNLISRRLTMKNNTNTALM